MQGFGVRFCAALARCRYGAQTGEFSQPRQGAAGQNAAAGKKARQPTHPRTGRTRSWRLLGWMGCVSRDPLVGPGALHVVPVEDLSSFDVVPLLEPSVLNFDTVF